MNTTARDRLVHVLAGDPASYSDVATLCLPSDAITLHVHDVGPLTLPVRAAQAKKLIAVARPAKFGRGEETLSDTTIRDTWELTPDQVALGGTNWDSHLRAALAHVRYELGLPAEAELRAELNSMLIYGKGQFFLPHQDSEKQDAMVATLVVCLPSVHTGGELVVDDGGTERTFRGSRDEVVLVAFYSNRRHEVKPVRSGHRVTLTFNLMLTEPPTPSCDPGPAEQVARHLTEHFTAPAPRRYGGDDTHQPIRMAFLLDHEYTEAGLQSQRFKGADAERVAVLRDAAERAGCETVFALVEVREICAAIPKGQSGRYGGYGGGPYDLEDYVPEGGSDAVEDYDLGFPKHEDVTLGWWVRADGSGAESINLRLGEHEVCAVTPSRSMTPYASEYQGYMGNEGNTIERWYRRAAVVIWPNEKAFAARAEAAPAWALATLLDRIETGDLDGARSAATSLAPVWHRVENRVLPAALDVAAGLRDPRAARVVLEPFELEMLTAEDAAGLAALVREYGDPWVDELIDQWAMARRFARVVRTTWVADNLLPLSRALRENEAALLADHIGDIIWRWLSTHIDVWFREADTDRGGTSLSGLGLPLARLLEAASDEGGARITAALCAKDDDIMELLVETLRAHRPPSRSAFHTIAEDCRDRLARLVDAPNRTADDLATPWTGCGCDLCLRLVAFLASPSERTLEWPVATPGREHVLRQIGASTLPVRHTIRRQGRPFTLVLQKI